MIKKYFLFFAILISFNTIAGAQVFEWVDHKPSTYTLNPGMIAYPLTVIPTGGLVSAHMDQFYLNYSQNSYGNIILEKKDDAGNLLWTYFLNNKVSVKRITSDAQGNIYVGGMFMDTLDLNGADQLIEFSNINSYNIFLIKLDSNGTLQWKRNVSEFHSQNSIEDIQVDPQGSLWYTLNNFNYSVLYKTDNTGIDTDSLILEGTLILSSFSFDPWGNIYIAGSTENGTMTFGNQSFTVPYFYNVFIGRYDMNHNASWVYFAEDITFHHPKVVSDQNGNAVMGGTYFQSRAFGTLQFPDPQWSLEFYLFKIDSSGIFQWGKSNPAGLNPITGRFSFQATETIDVDGMGNIYIAGISAGVMDWGNGVVLTSGTGQLSDNMLSVLSFDASGNIRWGKVFGSDYFSMFYYLKSTQDGDCYFAASVRDTSVYDSLIFPGTIDLDFVSGKISRLQTTGISELKNVHHSVFPNPSQGMIYLSGIHQVSEYTMYDLGGKIIRSGKYSPGSAIDTSPLPDGFYLVHVNTDNQPKNFRWIKVSE